MQVKYQVLLCAQLMLVILHAKVYVRGNEWMTQAQNTLKEALDIKPNTNIAKNVIFYLGDGMGISTVTAGRIYKGQYEGKVGERTVLSFEKFTNVALSKTYNVDYYTPDSAATATAYFCGVKANYGTVGVDETVQRYNCSAQEAGKVTSIFKWSQDAGKSLGIISTARVTHATPAATYAYAADRNWEGDLDTEDVDCQDISQQMIYNLDIQVILGGGRETFLLNTTTDPETGTIGKKQRRDGKDLIEDWKRLRSVDNKHARYVWNKGQFDDIDPAKTDYLLGLFSPSHMDYEIDRDSSSAGQPSLAEMTRKAIKILEKNNKGFLLMVEGGKIDHGHHANKPKKALHDVMAFDEAVAMGVSLTKLTDTLHVVTADHSHVFNIGGYPKSGDDILGTVKPYSSADTPHDGMPKTILIYGNGPGGERANLTNVDTTDKEYRFPTAVKSDSETHAGEDVAIYAMGPMAHLFYGVREQNYIAHAMAYASCVGTNKQHCDKRPTTDIPCSINGSPSFYAFYTLFSLILSMFSTCLINNH